VEEGVQRNTRVFLQLLPNLICNLEDDVWFSIGGEI
jgi:hypothetical protein